MAFTEVKGGDIQFKKAAEFQVGESVTGKWVKTLEKEFKDKIAKTYVLQVGQDQNIGVSGSGQLDWLMAQLETGVTVRITYQGLKKLPNAPQPAHQWKVEVDDSGDTGTEFETGDDPFAETPAEDDPFAGGDTIEVPMSDVELYDQLATHARNCHIPANFLQSYLRKSGIKVDLIGSGKPSGFDSDACVKAIADIDQVWEGIVKATGSNNPEPKAITQAVLKKAFDPILPKEKVSA